MSIRDIAAAKASVSETVWAEAWGLSRAGMMLEGMIDEGETIGLGPAELAPLAIASEALRQEVLDMLGLGRTPDGIERVEGGDTES